jgi:hypothetical protein
VADFPVRMLRAAIIKTHQRPSYIHAGSARAGAGEGCQTPSTCLAGLYRGCAYVGAGYVGAQANDPPMVYEPFARRRCPWKGEVAPWLTAAGAIRLGGARRAKAIATGVTAAAMRRRPGTLRDTRERRGGRFRIGRWTGQWRAVGGPVQHRAPP